MRLLVDTGSVHTILAVEVLESIGCSPAASTDHIRIITGSGFLIAARVKADGFQCLGRKIQDMPLWPTRCRWAAGSTDCWGWTSSDPMDSACCWMKE